MDTNYIIADDGILEPRPSVQHRDDEYPEDGLAALWAIQERHFWYRGRHRFLRHALARHHSASAGPLSAVALGGGVGGWVRYLAARRPGQNRPLAEFAAEPPLGHWLRFTWGTSVLGVFRK